MKRLSARRMEKVFEFLQQSYRAQDLDEFANTVPSALSSLIEADMTTYSEVNPLGKRVGWHHKPSSMPLLTFHGSFEQFMHTDPVVTWYANGADGRAIKISDLMTRRQFHSTAIYNEFYRHLDLEHQIAFLLDTAKPLLIGMTLNRSSKEFTEEDRLTLNVLRPHLIHAYRNAFAMTQLALMAHGIEDTGRAVILLSQDGRTFRATTKARQWLAAYFNWPGRGSPELLPDGLHRWLSQEIRRRAESNSLAHPALPFSIANERGALTVRAVVHQDQVLLLFDERPKVGADDPTFLRTLESTGLSARESQILAWVVQGKTNPEIAVILSLSSRTVQTHLDHIYRKLDVTTRAAATAKAMEARAAARTD